MNHEAEPPDDDEPEKSRDDGGPQPGPEPTFASRYEYLWSQYKDAPHVSLGEKLSLLQLWSECGDD